MEDMILDMMDCHSRLSARPGAAAARLASQKTKQQPENRLVSNRSVGFTEDEI
jgi:hypothetical protein